MVCGQDSIGLCHEEVDGFSQVPFSVARVPKRSTSFLQRGNGLGFEVSQIVAFTVLFVVEVFDQSDATLPGSKERALGESLQVVAVREAVVCERFRLVQCCILCPLHLSFTAGNKTKNCQIELFVSLLRVETESHDYISDDGRVIFSLFENNACLDVVSCQLEGACLHEETGDGVTRDLSIFEHFHREICLLCRRRVLFELNKRAGLAEALVAPEQRQQLARCCVLLK